MSERREPAVSSGPAGDRQVAWRLLSLIRPYLLRMSLAGACLLVSTGATLVFPYTIRLLTDGVFVHHNAAALNRAIGLLVVVVLVSAAASFFREYLLSYVGGRVVTDLRLRLCNYLYSCPLAFFDERRTGDLMSRLSTDTTVVQAFLTGGLLSLIQQVVTLVGTLVIVIVLDWRLALVAFAVAPLLAVAALLTGRATRRLSREALEQLGVANVLLAETLSAMRVVIAFGREKYEVERYSDAVTRSFDISMSAAKVRALLGSIMLVVGFGSIAGVLWFGAREVLAGHLTPGGLISFLFYLAFLIGPLQALASLYGQFQNAAGGASRIFELLDLDLAMADAPDAYPLPPASGAVDISNLRFRYGAELPPAVRDINLKVEAGKTIALVGPSGAGKTTLVSLVARFYDPESGTICIDGHDVRHVTVASLRTSMAIVPQEATLFSGTVRENIAYGKLDATQEEIEAAAWAANAHDFISALPDGYDSLIGERGLKLSGGQRQRIAIARALLRNPRILILDEATSSLDNESEALVQEALARLMADRTTFVIAHRLTTVERADQVVVLDKGRIVEQGTHRELLARGGLYHRLYVRAAARNEDIEQTESISA